jgi:hypothetical protein
MTSTVLLLFWCLSLFRKVQMGSGAQPVSHRAGTGILFLGVKWQECEAASSAEVKNGEVVSALPTCLLEHR